MTDTYAASTGCNIEYITGSESHTSTWAKFWVKGLDKWAVREEDGCPTSDKHSSYHQYVCLDIPEGTVFTIFEQDGDKRGTDVFQFWICKASKEFGQIKSGYDPRRHCTGNFEILVEGAGKTKAPRLLGWWTSFCGEKNEKQRSNEEMLAFAAHCAEYINKRGIKELPEFQPQTQQISRSPAFEQAASALEACSKEELAQLKELIDEAISKG